MSNFKTRVTIYEVAKASGYSLATVSRVINKKENVTPETKEKIMATIERLGYKPSALAQGLATSKSTNIGLVLPSKNYTYLSNILSGLADIAKIYGYQTTLFLTSSDKEEAKETIEKLITSHVDGAIIYDDALTDKDILEIGKYQIPVVVIGHEINAENFASIEIHYESEIRKVIRNYLEKNNDNIYLLKQEDQGLLMSKVEKIIQDEMKSLNKENMYNEIIINDIYTDTYAEFNKYFKEHKNGFYITSRDSISCAVVNAALDNGLSIPEDIQVISIIGTKYSTIMRPKLSSIYIDMYEVGSIAMRMLTKALEGTLKKKTFEFNAEIQYRESTKN